MPVLTKLQPKRILTVTCYMTSESCPFGAGSFYPVGALCLGHRFPVILPRVVGVNLPEIPQLQLAPSWDLFPVRMKIFQRIYLPHLPEILNSQVSQFREEFREVSPAQDLPGSIVRVGQRLPSESEMNMEIKRHCQKDLLVASLSRQRMESSGPGQVLIVISFLHLV